MFEFFSFPKHMAERTNKSKVSQNSLTVGETAAGLDFLKQTSEVPNKTKRHCLYNHYST